MLSHKLLFYFTMSYLYCLLLPCQATNSINGNSEERKSKTAKFKCMKKPDCTSGIKEDETTVLELGGNMGYVFRMNIDDNDSALKISFESDSRHIKAIIFISKPSSIRQENIIVTSSADKPRSWDIVIPAETIKRHSGDIVTIRVENENEAWAIVKITTSFQGAPTLLIVLGVIGGIAFIFLIALAIWCLLLRKRHAIQIGFPIQQNNQVQEDLPDVSNTLNTLQVQIQRNNRAPIISVDLSNNSPSLDPTPQPEPLTIQNINSHFPEIYYQYLDSYLTQTTCSICLEEMKTGIVCRQLHCNHIFHSECIKSWLINKLTKEQAVCCPNCNKDISEAQPDIGKSFDLHDSHIILMLPETENF